MERIEFVEEADSPTRIKVVGVGGGGSNAVDSMLDMGLAGVDFCNINTDTQALSLSKCPNKLHIGDDVTGGMGCGGDPAIGMGDVSHSYWRRTAEQFLKSGARNP